MLTVLFTGRLTWKEQAKLMLLREGNNQIFGSSLSSHIHLFNDFI